ncbi:hypothetical protein ACFHYQ_08750 [Sphaerimonospora cavernae]|uniref:Uncharacterized protein n=1 Tax=Sphaerimonospora cavernae TaxID=1740611 RepID=A0ABV6U1P7_9ACTN
MGFVYDIADLYKARVTIPLAFSLHASTDPEREARRRLREDFRAFKLMPQIVMDIRSLFDPSDGESPAADRTPDLVHLWDPQAGPLPAGVNYGFEATSYDAADLADLE